jgi:dTDP-4-amino-4,6-dideoxygalactose transaminase
MQFRDLNKQYLALKNTIDDAMLSTALKGDFISGQAISMLERDLADYVGVKHCITCANGTDALTLALKVWSIGKADAVFVPDFTFIATAEVVSLEGATPVFVDVDPDTFNMSPISLEESIKNTLKIGELTPRAIIPVDLFGLPADFQKIKQIANRYNLRILEDCAQGLGGQIYGRMAGSFGDISTTSFFPAKPLGCYGDGGAIFTNNDEWATLIQSLRVHGKGLDKYDNVRIGFNSRLDTIQAAILLAKLDAFKSYELKRVNEFADSYNRLLNDYVKIPLVPPGYYSSWAQYTITVRNHLERDSLQAYLKEREIPTMVYYPKSIHAQTAYAHHRYTAPNDSVSDQLSKTVLSLPMHPYLNEEDIRIIVETIHCFKKCL